MVGFQRKEQRSTGKHQQILTVITYEEVRGREMLKTSRYSSLEDHRTDSSIDGGLLFEKRRSSREK